MDAGPLVGACGVDSGEPVLAAFWCQPRVESQGFGERTGSDGSWGSGYLWEKVPGWKCGTSEPEAILIWGLGALNRS